MRALACWSGEPACGVCAPWRSAEVISAAAARPKTEGHADPRERCLLHLVQCHHVLGELRQLLDALDLAIPVDRLLDVCQHRLGS